MSHPDERALKRVILSTRATHSGACSPSLAAPSGPDQDVSHEQHQRGEEAENAARNVAGSRASTVVQTSSNVRTAHGVVGGR